MLLGMYSATASHNAARTLLAQHPQWLDNFGIYFTLISIMLSLIFVV